MITSPTVAVLKDSFGTKHSHTSLHQIQVQQELDNDKFLNDLEEVLYELLEYFNNTGDALDQWYKLFLSVDDALDQWYRLFLSVVDKYIHH